MVTIGLEDIMLAMNDTVTLMPPFSKVAKKAVESLKMRTLSRVIASQNQLISMHLQNLHQDFQ